MLRITDLLMTSLMVQRLRLCAPNAGAVGSGSIPGQRTRILHACCMAQPKNKNKDMKTLEKKSCILMAIGKRSLKVVCCFSALL